MVDISVVVCTFRRQQTLAALLDSLTLQTFAPIRFEVVVVDNDMDRSSRELVARYAGSIPNLVYCSEPSLGLSNARMEGARNSGGEWIAYLDDDCVAEESFLEELAHCIRRGGNPGVISGPVLPIWPHALPGWLTPDLYPYLSLCNYQGPADGFQLDFPIQYPVGANIAYPKDLVMEMGGFRPDLGRSGDVLLSGEETDLNFRIQKAGYGLWYCPNAIVHHLIPAQRLEKAFFRRRYYWAGRTWTLLHLYWFGASRIRREVFRRMTYNLAGLIYYGAIVRRNPFLAECLVRESLGYVVEALQILKRGIRREGGFLQVSKA